LNSAQRTAALIVRLAGFAVLVLAVLGLISILIVWLRAGNLAGLPAEAMWSPIARIVIGLLLLALGRPIGVWLGSGLD
jgi:hypothetical protein